MFFRSYEKYVSLTYSQCLARKCIKIEESLYTQHPALRNTVIEKLFSDVS